MLLIDASLYNDQQAWITLLNGVTNLVSQLGVGFNDTHVACVTFDSNATLWFGLTDYLTLGQVNNAILAIPNSFGGRTESLNYVVGYTFLNICTTELHGRRSVECLLFSYRA